MRHIEEVKPIGSRGKKFLTGGKDKGFRYEKKLNLFVSYGFWLCHGHHFDNIDTSYLKLSILIPTLNEPRSLGLLKRLRGILDPQVAKYPGEVEVRIHDAGRSMPTGTKRNELVANSSSEYFSQIDCDDVIADDYVQHLMHGINSGVDVITFCGHMTTNGSNRRNFVIKLGEKYEERAGVYYRHPNHLCCLKRSVVEHVKFRPIWQQEDYYYALDLKNKGLLKTEYHITKDMYHYDFWSKK